MNTSILVVDDERAIQDALAWGLRIDGHEVQTAGDAEEAMAIMAGQDFDVLIQRHHHACGERPGPAPQDAPPPPEDARRPYHRIRHGGDGGGRPSRRRIRLRAETVQVR